MDFGKNKQKISDNTALSSCTPPHMRRVLYWENTALSSCGGYVRRVQYYPCECSKRLYTLYTSKILIFLVFFFARKLIFLHAKVVINYLKAKSCTKTGLTAKNRGKIIQ